MIENLNVATANALEASAHVNNIVAALDNPKTINELRQTAANAAQLSAKIEGWAVMWPNSPQILPS